MLRKKIILGLLGLSIIGGSMSASASILTDINNHWSRQNVSVLVDRGIVNGFPSGEFQPEGTMTTEAFVKMAVVSINSNVRNAKAGEYWFAPYLEKAIALGIVKSWEIKSPKEANVPIPRYQMARILVRAMEIKEKPISSGNLNAEVFSDLNNEKFDIFVRQAAAAGLVTGYPDGTFQGNKETTRAEASVMVHRLIDHSVRAETKLSLNAPSKEAYQKVLMEAERLRAKRVPYLYGGNSEDVGIDCSRYMQLIYAKAGINLPRTSSLQQTQGIGIRFSEAMPGDLLFFDLKTNYTGRTSHVGMYIGGNMMIHIGDAKYGIEHRTLSNWHHERMLAVRRVL
jgi:cell wall-associated NlpC family hydrolase